MSIISELKKLTGISRTKRVIKAAKRGRIDDGLKHIFKIKFTSVE